MSQNVTVSSHVILIMMTYIFQTIMLFQFSWRVQMCNCIFHQITTTALNFSPFSSLISFNVKCLVSVSSFLQCNFFNSWMLLWKSRIPWTLVSYSVRSIVLHLPFLNQNNENCQEASEISFTFLNCNGSEVLRSEWLEISHCKITASCPLEKT